MDNHRKRVLGAALAIGSIGVLIAAGASAGAVPAGGCPKGGHWDGAFLASTDPALDVGNFHDQNDDGSVCQFSNPNKNKGNDGHPAWVVKDNTKPLEPNNVP